MSITARQLPLPLDHSPRYDAAEFHPTAGSQAALEWLEKPALWSQNRLILWGEPGCGKTHLLHIWAQSHAAVFINGPALRGLPSEITAPLAIDDIDLIADETSLFHYLNAATQARLPVLLAARQPPSRLRLNLPDLTSRLRASMAVEITAPDDAERAALLARLAAARQLVLNIQVINYLLTHLPRTPAALIEAITRLDRAALANGGKISRHLAASLLKDIANAEQTGSEMLSNRHSPDNPGLL